MLSRDTEKQTEATKITVFFLLFSLKEEELMINGDFFNILFY